MKYLFFIVFLTGCASKFGDPRTISGIHPDILPYVEMYLMHKPSSKMNYDIPIQFSKLPSPSVGLCTRWLSGHRQIEIDKAYWDSLLSENQKITLIFHELGHCDLNRDHITQFRTDKPWMPYSLMYPEHFTFYGYDDKLHYFLELFNELVHTTSSKTEETCVRDIEVE